MLSPRDVEILRSVHRFGQLTSGHVRALVFAACRSDTSSYRVLGRLTETRFLTRLERRGIGGWKGGSGQWVYQLGERGYQLLDVEPSERRRRVVMNEHAIGIADCFVASIEAERRGEIAIHNVAIEHEGSIAMGNVELIPDLTLHLSVTSLSREGSVFVEIDTGVEGRSKIEEKLEHYTYLWNNWPHDTFPRVIFLSTYAQRLPGLARKIELAPAGARHLFQVDMVSNFPQLLWSK